MLIQICLTKQLTSYTYFTIFLKVGKMKVTENSEDKHCQISALKMTNGIRKVSKEVDIIPKKILILVTSSQTVLQNRASSTAIIFLQPTEYKPVS